jgi:hypothetical protein
MGYKMAKCVKCELLGVVLAYWPFRQFKKRFIKRHEFIFSGILGIDLHIVVSCPDSIKMSCFAALFLVKQSLSHCFTNDCGKLAHINSTAIPF